MKQPSSAHSPNVFTIVWIGQLVSIIGSGLATFALGVWVFEQTGSALMFALIMLFRSLPGALISPIAGALVDRWDRRRVMIVSDGGAALATLGVALLAATGNLAIWHIYLLTAISSILLTFQQPAYFASITLLVPREHYARANGMVQAGLGAEHIISPVLAGILLPFIHLSGIMTIDLITFLIGVAMLLLVRFPRQPAPTEGTAGTSLLAEIQHSWTYLATRPGLFSLMLFIALCNFLLGFFIALIVPMVLSFTTAQALGTATSIAGSGMLAGSILMAIWGGPRRLIYGLFGAMILFGTGMILAGLQPSVILITLGGFLLLFSPPVANGCIFAIWQRKVAANMQGRIFATARMVALLAAPAAYLSAGLLAENFFVPLLVPGGNLAETIGAFIGVGPGRGIALMFIIMGSLSILSAVAGYLYPRLRLIETELPEVSFDEPASESSPETILADVPA